MYESDMPVHEPVPLLRGEFIMNCGSTLGLLYLLISFVYDDNVFMPEAVRGFRFYNPLRFMRNPPTSPIGGESEQICSEDFKPAVQRKNRKSAAGILYPSGFF